ncbi:alpha/beta hydrolase [Micromonospora sp. C31]|uniref:alpha/beta fold hydrolase n=1 Tax=Micromonospora sp. C31 TaxID=2824876 RepID=UPI001B3966B1|nr:alpha/beta hydrolase [Micromonospora sp. C31]MBQ1073202.1 alpha/beta hydrolase [Micromonospora sp. C31]
MTETGTAAPEPPTTPNDIAQSAAGPRRPRWWRHPRGWLKVATIAVLLVLVGWLALRDTTPVGYFTSAEGRDRFAAAYDRAMAELPPPAATLDVRTTYGVVRLYRFDGANPGRAPLVLVPGRAAASPLWADNLDELLRLRSVYTMDLLGEPGMSVQARPIEDHADQAAWFHQVLLRLPEPRVHLVGYSIGGWTAANVAIRQPGKIAGVVLIDPVVTFADLPFETIVRSIPASVPWTPKSWRDSFNSWTAGGAPVEDEPVAEMIESGMRHYSLDLPAPTRFTDAQLRGLDLPALVIIAEASVMHDARQARRTAEATLTQATVRFYEGASHAVNGEQPERIAADVGAFLAATP